MNWSACYRREESVPKRLLGCAKNSVGQWTLTIFSIELTSNYFLCWKHGIIFMRLPYSIDKIVEWLGCLS